MQRGNLLESEDMMKPATLFVAASMAVTAACVGVILFSGLGYGVGASSLTALGALAGMAVTHLAFVRAPEPDYDRLDDLDRVVTDLQSRLETLELRVSTLDSAGQDRARAATRPVVEEIAALGGLVTSIAKEVAAHDVRLSELSAPKLRGEPSNAGNATPSLAPEPKPQPVVESQPAAATTHPAGAAAPLVVAAAGVAPRPAPAPEPFNPDEPEPAFAVDEASDADRGVAARLELALRDDRIDVHLQPIVSLPSRRTLHYEALARMIESSGVADAAEFVPAAVATGRVASIDCRVVERAAAVALRLAASGRTGTVFVNMSAQTLQDPAAVATIVALLESQSELARLIVIELDQSVFAGLSPVARDGLNRLTERNVRISLDNANDLRIDPRDVARQGVRFIKVAASRLLDPEAARGASIHPADFSGLLARHGVDLIVTHVDEERTVPELLDMDAKAAQGFLFGAPRPVRPAAAPPASAPAAAPQPTVQPPQPAERAPQRLVPRSYAAR